jgi:hypothetical protein
MSALSKFETPEPAEDQLIARIADILQRKMERDYPPGATRRDAHAKHVALVRAVFTVEPDLPPELRVGLFGSARSYDAWVRLSNANGEPQSDAIADVRGCAIKVLGVAGARIAESDAPAVQDFLMVSMPTMPLGTVKLFHDAIHYSIESTMLLFVAKMLLTGRTATLKAMRRVKLHPTSPVDIRYWSTTPYLFGPQQAAKYSVVPTSPRRSTLPATLTDTYLSDNLEQHLAEADASFDFKLQLRTQPTMPIEDAAVEWTEAQSPFVKVATLRIPKQDFRSVERDEMSERLAFSPAHAGLDHRPIGAVNRARMRIYKLLSSFRHARDQRAPAP